MLVSLSVLLNGCMMPECSWTQTIGFGDQHTIDWLLENDRVLLQDVTVHNETRERVCT
jgi:hypothetical protein